MAPGSGIEQSGLGSSLFSAEVQAAVRVELQMMLANPIFAQSNRCKSFLSYVVQQTLSGSAADLKERTIGIDVFERSNDYDTGDDSIVRVTANEVRKRLGQFYRESQSSHTIQIELPRGAYVPEFKILPDRTRSKDEAAESPKPPAEVQVASPVTTADEILLARPVGLDTRTAGQPATDEIGPRENFGMRRLSKSIALVVIVLAVSAAVFEIWQIRAQHQFPQLWNSFLNSKLPVLLCIDAHDLRTNDVTSSKETDRFFDEILHKQIISVDDAAVLGSMAGLLGKKGIPFRVAGAEETSLTDFRRQPVILIGAVGNKWTIAVTRNLPYRIEVSFPLGPGEAPVASIVAADHSSGGPWRIDFSIPLSQWKNDYAIVAKMDDPTTGVPILIEAGLGNDGSLTASELLSSDSLIAEIRRTEGCHQKSNFEAVIQTEIISREPGPPHILRLKCW